MKEEMNMAILFGEGYLNGAPPEKNSEVAAQNKKIYELAKAKWQKRKETLAAELTQQLLKDIEVTFSVPELKYLIEVSKASVFKRYKLFLKSDEFGKVYNMPTLIARGFVEEGKKAFATPVKGLAR
ncbi:MAG: hypothetical protein H7256_08665 [Bdellovibrio sp.]|nr:hypothetical protein [Bdellovibrio sp.]